MSDVPPAPATSRPIPGPAVREPRWGLGDAAIAWLVAQTCAALALPFLLAAFDHTQQQAVDGEVSLAFTALQFPPLWIGFVGVPIFVAARKGAGWVADYRARIKAIDVPIGVVAGVLTQIIAVPLVSLPVLWLAGTDFDELGEPARQLGERATSPGTVVLLFLMVAIGAPIAEELFFRGLLLRAFEKRFGTGWAVALSSVVFGATHFQLLQFPALTVAGLVFALLAVKSGRLGPAVVAHMAFNTVTVVNLVWFAT